MPRSAARRRSSRPVGGRLELAASSARSAWARSASSAGSGPFGNARVERRRRLVAGRERGLASATRWNSIASSASRQVVVIRRPPRRTSRCRRPRATRRAAGMSSVAARANALGVLADVRGDELGRDRAVDRAAASRRPATASRRATCSSSSMISCACMSAVCAPNDVGGRDGRLGPVEVEDHAVVQRDDHPPGRHRLHRVADVLVLRRRERGHRDSVPSRSAAAC